MVDVGEMMGLKQLGLYPAMFARGARLKDVDFKTYAGFYMDHCINSCSQLFRPHH